MNTPNLISFDTFCPVTVKEICKTIMCCPTTSCVLDPLPTQLLKTNVDILSPVITRIVNLSLTTGKFPSSQKSAKITPLLKKASLDPKSLKNYRPVSNLTGGGPRVVVSTAAFHARVRGSVPGLGGLKETKNVSSSSTCESQYCGEPP